MDFAKVLQVSNSENVENEWAGGSDLKRKTTTKSVDKGNETLTRELDALKLISNLAQKTRLHASILMWTIMLPAAILSPAITLAKEFGAANKGVKNHGKGSPHPMVWRSVLETLISTIKLKIPSVNETTRANLNQAMTIVEKHLADFIASGPKKSYFHIRQAMVRTTRDEGKSILKFEVSSLLAEPRNVQMALLFLMEGAGGAVLEGTEAPTDLERKVQTHIETLKTKLS